MLAEVKRQLALRGDDWDAAVADNCLAAAQILRTRGVILPGTVSFSEEAVTDGVRITDGSTVKDRFIIRTIALYVAAHLGSPPNYEQLRAAWDEHLAQLMTTTGYTDFGGDEE